MTQSSVIAAAFQLGSQCQHHRGLLQGTVVSLPVPLFAITL